MALLLLLLLRVACAVQIHWFSIINSCVTVLLLTGFLATILMRVLKADFVKFSREDGETQQQQQQQLWGDKHSCACCSCHAA
jgi:cytochrome c553